MNEQPKSFWPNIWSRPLRTFSWLAALSGAATVISDIIVDKTSSHSDEFAALRIVFAFACIFVLSVLGLILSAIPQTRFLVAWSLRRWFFCAATLVTLLALFNAEENWRGKRAFERLKRNLQAEGLETNWDKLIPRSVPDEENIFKAPKMQEWFVRDLGRDSNSNELSGLLRSPKEFPAPGAKEKINTESAARAYLAWSDKLQPQFDLIRTALKRPYARMDGDYSDIFTLPVQNFVNIREVARVLAQRSHCYLILHQPDRALDELTFIHDLRRLIETEPGNKPMTLVSAMINVAVAGLYVDTLGEGFELRAWQEPQLVVLQKQLSEIHLVGPLVMALQTEPVAATRAMERVSLGKIAHSWPIAGSVLTIAPNGWIYQNMATEAELFHAPAEGMNIAQDTVSPSLCLTNSLRAQKILHRRTPFNIFAQIMLPNISKAAATTARNQSRVNLALTACALERYRLARGEYPDSLSPLVPHFIDKVPLDVINGGELKYRKNGSGFVLYSVGWNEKDDGGNSDSDNENPNGKDWVWQFSGKE